MLWYAVILGIAVIGLISLIMSYDEMKRSHLILAALSILPAIGVFIHMGTSRESVGEVVKTALPPNVIDNLNLYIIGGVVLIIGLLYAEGTITWIWRRVHPKSAPTDELGIGQQGHGNFARKGQSYVIIFNGDVDIYVCRAGSGCQNHSANSAESICAKENQSKDCHWY